MSTEQMVRHAAQQGLVIFTFPDGTSAGIGTRSELDALIADEILPADMGTRAVTKADL